MKKSKEIDLLTDEYWILGWPMYKLHSTRFPYLVFRLAGGVFAPTATPDNLKDGLALLEWARDQEAEYQFPVCLVMSPTHAYYINQPGKLEESKIPASGGTIINWEKFKIGEIRQRGDDKGGTIFWTENPKSQNRSAYSTGERIELGGDDSKIKAN